MNDHQNFPQDAARMRRSQSVELKMEIMSPSDNENPVLLSEQPHMSTSRRMSKIAFCNSSNAQEEEPQTYAEALPGTTVHQPGSTVDERTAAEESCLDGMVQPVPGNDAPGQRVVPLNPVVTREQENYLETSLALCDDDYPEGGLRAYLVVAGSCFATFVTLGLMNTVGSINQYVSENQLKQYGVGTIGWIFSVFIFIGFFGGIQTGPIFDSQGPRMLILSGSICIGTSMMLLGICTQYWHFMLCFGILGGIGTSLIFTPALSAVSHFFLRKRGMATGIAAAGGSLGGIVFPLTLQKLFPTVGFAGATRAVGFIVILCCALAFILIRSRLPPKPRQSVIPDLRILSQQAYLSLTLGIYFMEWALFIPITYITLFAASTGATHPDLSYQLIVILNAGSCIGRTAPGYVADKLGAFNTMISALALCAAMTLSLWLPASILTPNTSIDADTIEKLSIVYVIVFGIASGSNVSLAPVCVGKLCSTSEYGRYYATCYTIVAFGTLTGIPIAGSLIQKAGGYYWGVVIWTTLCYVAALGCFIWSRTCCVGWKLGVKF